MTARVPPGPGKIPFDRNPIELFDEFRREYGDFVQFRSTFGATTVAYHPPTVRRILYDRIAFPRSRVVSIILGEGLLASEGDLWHRQRRAYQPKFHPKAIETYADVMAEEAEATVDQWKVKMEAGENIELFEEMLQYSLRVASRILLGVPADDKEAMRSLCSATSDVISYLGHMGNTLPMKYTPENNRNHRQALQILRRVTEEFIDRRRENPEGPDLLGTLMYAKDDKGNPAIPRGLLRDEVATILLGGHETTAVSLAWAMWEFVSHPEFTQELCETEWREILGSQRPQWEQLPSLVRTQSAIREVHRLYPPVWSLVRRVAEDTDVEGYRLNAGEFVLVSPYMVHRHPDAWSEPNAVNFDRFIDGIPKTLMKGSYIPFGVGPHVCVGQHVANTEMLIALPIFMRAFKMTPIDPTPLGVLPLLTLRPGREILVRLEPRA